ncbi:shugoshin-like 2 [Platysternon megacephalum]|uniref:Shugoshin-like 2 n=1 Tax=Platysternon megacephalum TaxID=55544 RepID=A0A4D9F356_9SAUR|nr:shugoshin-like 2 [Platysternon megacephalum]
MTDDRSLLLKMRHFVTSKPSSPEPSVTNNLLPSPPIPARCRLQRKIHRSVSRREKDGRGETGEKSLQIAKEKDGRWIYREQIMATCRKYRHQDRGDVRVLNN